jgi:hypothetical protein
MPTTRCDSGERSQRGNGRSIRPINRCRRAHAWFSNPLLFAAGGERSARECHIGGRSFVITSEGRKNHWT